MRGILQNSIKILSCVNKYLFAYKYIILNHDTCNIISINDIHIITQKSTISCSHILASQHMNNLTRKNCCEAAIKELQILGIGKAAYWEVVHKCNIQFRQNRVFIHLNPYIANGKKRDPPQLFQYFPECKQLLIYYCRDNISNLKAGLVHQHLTNTILTKLTK